MQRLQFCKRFFPLVLVLSHYHVDELHYPIVLVEHALSPAKPDPFRAVLASKGCAFHSVGICPYLNALHFRGPLQNFLKLRRNFRLYCGHLVCIHFAGRAIYCYFLTVDYHFFAAHAKALVVRIDLYLRASYDARLAHSAGNYRSVRGLAAAACQYACGLEECRDIVRFGVFPY